jgi:hypothetical protein
VIRYIDKSLGRLDSDRIVLLDPQPGRGRSMDHFIEANIFDLPARIRDVASPDYISGAYIEICQSLFDQPLTEQMKTLFKYSTQLMDQVGKPSMPLLRDIIDDPERFLADNDDAEVERFFTQKVLVRGSIYKKTAEYVSARLDTLMGYDTMRRMFCSDAPKVNLFDKVLDGCLLLAATRTAAVSEDCARTIGRLTLMIGGQISQAKAFCDGKPSIMLADEAHEYTIEKDISSIRMSYKKDRKNQDGRALALQQPDDFCPLMFKTVTNNAAVKCVGRMENPDDAAKMARIMRVPADDIMSLKTGEFCVMVRGQHERGIIVNVPPGSLGLWRTDKQRDAMQKEAHDSVDKCRAIMARRYGSAKRKSSRVDARKKLKMKRVA